MKNIKYAIYQAMGRIFPGFFRNRVFGRLKGNLSGKDAAPPENELLILHHFVTPDMTIVDVGANNGLYCYYFRDLIGCRNIHAFEPVHNLFSKLKKWFPDIHIYPFAVSDTSGTKTLRIPYIRSVRTETRAKLDNLAEEGENRAETVAIQSKTLDDLFLSGSEKVSFIKIDIEGHELAAIRGGKNLILRDQPILMIEIEARHHKDNFDAVIAEIMALGYDGRFFDRQRWTLVPVAELDLRIHQDPDRKPYINNFLFFPIGQVPDIGSSR